MQHTNGLKKHVIISPDMFTCQSVLTVGLNGKGLYTLSVTRQTALLTHGKNF